MENTHTHELRPDAQMEAKLGDYVKAVGQAKFGRVYAKHHNFKNTNEEMWWFKEQSYYTTLSESEKEELLTGRWYSILMQDGGAIMIPEKNIEAMSKEFHGKLNNSWESYYFNL